MSHQVYLAPNLALLGMLGFLVVGTRTFLLCHLVSILIDSDQPEPILDDSLLSLPVGLFSGGPFFALFLEPGVFL